MAKEEEFLRKIHAFSGIAGSRLDFIMRKIGLDAFNQLLRRSPVDSGRFRASWRYTVNTIDSSVEPRSKSGTKSSIKKGAPPTGEQTSAVVTANKTVTRDSVIHITNSLPYSVRLEQGYSTQAPNGIVGPTFLTLLLNITRNARAAKKAIPDA